MSVINYHYSLDNNPEEHNSHQLRGGSLKSRMKLATLIQRQIRYLHKPELSVKFVILALVSLGCDDVNFGRDRGRGQLKCDSTRAETRFRLSAKQTSPFKSAGGRQFSRLLAAEVCASVVVMLDTPCSEVV